MGKYGLRRFSHKGVARSFGIHDFCVSVCESEFEIKHFFLLGRGEERFFLLQSRVNVLNLYFSLGVLYAKLQCARNLARRPEMSTQDLCSCLLV